MRSPFKALSLAAAAVLMLGSAPAATADDAPVSQVEVVQSVAELGQSTTLVLLTDVEMSAVRGAGYCRWWRGLNSVVMGAGEVAYAVCKAVTAVRDLISGS